MGAFMGQLFSQIVTNKHVTPIIDMADKEIFLNVVFSEFIAVIILYFLKRIYLNYYLGFCIYVHGFVLD